MRFTNNIYTFEWGNEDFYGNKTQLNEALREWKHQDLGDEPDYQTLELVQVNKNKTAIYKQEFHSHYAGNSPNIRWYLFDHDYTDICYWDYDPTNTEYNKLISESKKITLREAVDQKLITEKQLTTFGIDETERQELMDSTYLYVGKSGSVFVEQMTLSNGSGLYLISASLYDAPIVKLNPEPSWIKPFINIDNYLPLN